MTDHLSRAHQLLASGQLDEARIYLEELLRQDPDNPDLLYNLGPLLRGPRPVRSGSRAPAPLPRARSRPLARLRGPGARLPAGGRPAASEGVRRFKRVAFQETTRIHSLLISITPYPIFFFFLQGIELI